MNPVVIVEWEFAPPDYFEETVEVSGSHYSMTIGKGKAEARIELSIYDSNPSMNKDLHYSLNSRFLGAQLLTHRPYKLSLPKTIRADERGRRNISVELESASLKISANPIDTLVTNKDGHIVQDSKGERLIKTRTFAELAVKHRSSDKLLNSLLNSYDTAVRNPNRELVHLYEIRDALSKQYSGESGAREQLGITSQQWKRLGQLCNDEPLRQGRHGGRMGKDLRDATQEELAEARDIGRSMIEAYLHTLKN